MGNGGSDLCCKLRSAAQNGRKEECVQFLKAGAMVSCQDNLYKSTALHEACRFGHHEVASLLVKHNAEVDALDCIGHTPLFYAAKGGFNSIINLLIEKGADVNVVSTKGKTALHSAMEHGHKVATLLLLDAGARLDARDCEGRTPSQLAAQSGLLKALVTCKLVLENSQSAKQVDSIIDLTDPKIPTRSRVLLRAWQVASKIGKPFPVPKTCAFEAESDEPMRCFLASLKMSPAERNVAIFGCLKRKREMEAARQAGACEEASLDAGKASPALDGCPLLAEQQQQQPPPRRRRISHEEQSPGNASRDSTASSRTTSSPYMAGADRADRIDDMHHAGGVSHGNDDATRDARTHEGAHHHHHHHHHHHNASIAPPRVPALPAPRDLSHQNHAVGAKRELERATPAVLAEEAKLDG